MGQMTLPRPFTGSAGRDGLYTEGQVDNVCSRMAASYRMGKKDVSPREDEDIPLKNTHTTPFDFDIGDIFQSPL